MKIELTPQQLNALKNFLIRVQQMMMPTEVSSYMEIMKAIEESDKPIKE